MKLKPSLRDLKAKEVDDYDGETDSETEALQEAFASGALKPGLNIPVIEKKFTNNVSRMRQRLSDLVTELPWIEKLDVLSKPALTTPELSVQLEEAEKDPTVHDDFKRESLFYRQAQSAVLDVLPKLKKLNIPTQRPDDYFAEMAKSDDHMQKVKINLMKRKTEVERIEKVRSLRAQRKLQKALNAQSKVEKQSSKKELMDQVKKFRKSENKDLSFLEGKSKSSDKKMSAKQNKSQLKKNYKNSKFGYGGKKRNSKRNTRESSNFEKKPQSKGRPSSKRPGKSVRVKVKGKKKK